MKIFTSNDFTGYWPVGTAAIVVAEDMATARSLMDAELAKLGLTPYQQVPPNEYTLDEVDPTKQQVIILRDGEY